MAWDQFQEVGQIQTHRPEGGCMKMKNFENELAPKWLYLYWPENPRANFNGTMSSSLRHGGAPNVLVSHNRLTKSRSKIGRHFLKNQIKFIETLKYFQPSKVSIFKNFIKKRINF